jgi:hypothetical protein
MHKERSSEIPAPLFVDIARPREPFEISYGSQMTVTIPYR